jgi:hypothetical protein
MNNYDIGYSDKGKLYFYWGWNWSWYSRSNISFTGDDYDFTLKSVGAKDRQSAFSFDTYFNPTKVTIPQYNFRIGYYFKKNWDISFGIDHMKYVVQQNQTLEIEGYIENTNPIYDHTYSDQSIQLTPDFLEFEHTDGLNYVNFELRHSDKVIDRNKVNISLIEGLGIGFLYPKTNTTLLGKERYDEFHLSGYGIGGVIGLKVTFFKMLLFQSELKGGFINLPNLRTTNSATDKASHDFFFSQFNIVFGGIINIKTKANRVDSPATSR